MSQSARNNKRKDSGLASPETNVVTPKEKKKGKDKPDKMFPVTYHRRVHSGQTESRDSDDSRHYNENETATSKTDKKSGLSESSDSPIKSQKSPSRDEKKVKKQLAYDELGSKKHGPKLNIPHNSSDLDVKKLTRKSVDITKIKDKPATVAIRPSTKYRDKTKRYSYQFEKINMFPEEIPSEKKKRRLSLESNQKSPLSSSTGPVLVNNTNNTNNNNSNNSNNNNTINNNNSNGAADDTKTSKQVRGARKSEKGSDKKKAGKENKKGKQ